MSKNNEGQDGKKKTDWKADPSLTMVIQKGAAWKSDAKLTMTLKESCDMKEVKKEK